MQRNAQRDCRKNLGLENLAKISHYRFKKTAKMLFEGQKPDGFLAILSHF